MVGFQNYDVVPAAGANMFKMTANTFIPVGLESIKLGDLKVTPKGGVALSTGNFYIMMVGIDGNPLHVSDDAQIAKMETGANIIKDYGSKLVKLVWVSAKNAWYLNDDSGSRARKYAMDTYEIPIGAGFLVYVDKTLTGGASITYSGQVADAAKPLSFGGEGVNEFHITANIAPANCKLSDLVVTSNDGTAISTGNFYIMMVGTDGNPLHVTDDAQIATMETGANIIKDYGSKLVKLVWVSAKNAWYLNDDSGSRARKYAMSDYVIPAGAGFLAYTDKTLPKGATLTLPSALEKDAE